MSELRWISKTAIVLLHAESLAEHGGMEGVRDAGLLESALSRARNLHAYDGVDDIAMLAAELGEDELASWVREYMDSRVHDGRQT